MVHTIKLTEEQKARFRKAREEGVKMPEISRALSDLCAAILALDPVMPEDERRIYELLQRAIQTIKRREARQGNVLPEGIVPVCMKEAAKRLSMTPQSIHRALKNAGVTTYPINRRAYVVDEYDLLAFTESRRNYSGTGRPKGAKNRRKKAAHATCSGGGCQ